MAWSWVGRGSCVNGHMLVRPRSYSKWKPSLISTASVAVGELGDKTQLLALILATRLRKPLPIIAGIFVATLLNHLGACLGRRMGGQADQPAALEVGTRYLLSWRSQPGR